jgi:hypothetical protein
MIPTIEELKKALKRQAGIVGVVTTFRMMSADGEDLEVVVRTMRRGKDLCVLDIRNALLATWRSKHNGEPPTGWGFIFEGVASA